MASKQPFPKTETLIAQETLADMNEALAQKGIDPIAEGSAFEVLLKSIGAQLVLLAKYAEETASSGEGG